MKMFRWHDVLPMATVSVVSGYGAAGVAKRIGRVAIRRDYSRDRDFGNSFPSYL